MICEETGDRIFGQSEPIFIKVQVKKLSITEKQ